MALGSPSQHRRAVKMSTAANGHYGATLQKFPQKLGLIIKFLLLFNSLRGQPPDGTPMRPRVGEKDIFFLTY